MIKDSIVYPAIRHYLKYGEIDLMVQPMYVFKDSYGHYKSMFKYTHLDDFTLSSSVDFNHFAGKPQSMRVRLKEDDFGLHAEILGFKNNLWRIEGSFWTVSDGLIKKSYNRFAQKVHLPRAKPKTEPVKVLASANTALVYHAYDKFPIALVDFDTEYTVSGYGDKPGTLQIIWEKDLFFIGKSALLFLE